MNSLKCHKLPKLIRFLLALFFAMTPLDYILPHLGSATLLVPAGAAIALVCVIDLINRRRWRLHINREEFVIVWLVLLNTISLLWAENFGAAVSNAVSFGLTGAIYFLLMSYEYSAEDIHLLETGSIIGGLLLIIYIASEVDVSLLLAGYRLDFDRLGGGAFSDPNGLAGRLMMPFLCSLKRLLHKAKGWKRALYLLLCGGTLLLIMLTGSRGGLLATGVAMFVLVNSYAKKKRYGTIFGVLILAGLVVVCAPEVLPEHIYLRIFSSSKYQEVLVLEGDRIDIWRHVLLDLFPKAPVLGYGAGNSSLALVEFYGRIKAVHNTHLLFLVELGLLGFVPWIIYIVGKMRDASSVKKEDPFCLAVFLSVLLIATTLDAAREKYLWNTLLYVYMSRMLYTGVQNYSERSNGNDTSSDFMRVFSAGK